MHDIVFTAFTGLIAFSSSSDLNYNPAVPMAVGTIVGFISSFGHTRIKAVINKS